MTHPEFLLIDISNAFTKIACATRVALDRPRRVPTPELSARRVRALVKASGARRVVVASVVPAATARIAPALPAETVHVGPAAAAGLRIEYPHPSSIGADRLANAVACIALFGKPSVVVDFGTAVTFDVISARGAYVGGVIAPGLNLMVDYLHSRTALLPHIRLAAPPRVVGKSTREAMLSGAVHGYRGLVAEILRRIRAEQFAGKKITVVATGGDAPLIAAALDLFDHSDPMLTLHGLRIIGSSHFPDRS
jgi:type III pantothenate kinase